MLEHDIAYRGPQLTSLSSFGMAAHLRKFCSCLLPVRASLQHASHTRHDAVLHRLEAASRCFGQSQRTRPFPDRHSITTCSAAKVSRSGSLLSEGEYGVDQIQVLSRRFLRAAWAPTKTLMMPWCPMSHLEMLAHDPACHGAGTRRLGSCKKAARHVHWQHRAERASSPGTHVVRMT